MQMKSSSRAFAGAVLMINTAFLPDRLILRPSAYILTFSPRLARHFLAFVANK
jgi:hypothetical protein